jgi:hypothetical protein
VASSYHQPRYAFGALRKFHLFAEKQMSFRNEISTLFRKFETYLVALNELIPAFDRVAAHRRMKKQGLGN